VTIDAVVINGWKKKALLHISGVAELKKRVDGSKRGGTNVSALIWPGDQQQQQRRVKRVVITGGTKISRPEEKRNLKLCIPRAVSDKKHRRSVRRNVALVDTNGREYGVEEVGEKGERLRRKGTEKFIEKEEILTTKKQKPGSAKVSRSWRECRPTKVKSKAVH